MPPYGSRQYCLKFAGGFFDRSYPSYRLFVSLPAATNCHHIIVFPRWIDLPSEKLTPERGQQSGRGGVRSTLASESKGCNCSPGCTVYRGSMAE